MQDFANYRTEFQRENTEGNASSYWSIDFKSMTIGILFGIFACLICLKIAQIRATNTVVVESSVPLEVSEDRAFEFDFYEELKSYEVIPRYR